jgi:hypothetical protein
MTTKKEILSEIAAELIPVPEKPKDLIYLFNKRTNEFDVIDPNTGLIVSKESSLSQKFKDYVYTPEAGMMICEAVRSGMTISQINSDPRFPPSSAIYYWMSKHKEFQLRYEQAFKQRGDHFHDKALEIALSTASKEEVNINKLKVDTLKWAAERADPERYGQKKADIAINQPSVIVLNTGIDREGAPSIEELLSKKEPLTIEGEVVSE